SDVDAFNLKLQQLVFGAEGLFSSWVDGRERSRAVGRIWRRTMSCLPREERSQRLSQSGCDWSCSLAQVLLRQPLGPSAFDSFLLQGSHWSFLLFCAIHWRFGQFRYGNPKLETLEI
ncbi:Centrosomal protein of 76 kDa, partial [Durusdinium trenchii]